MVPGKRLPGCHAAVLVKGQQMGNGNEWLRRALYGMVVWMACLPAMPQWNRFRVMEYNVENLFDCRHDSLHDDTEFLPTSVRKWDRQKLWTKLVALGKVIVAAGGEQVPDLVALCEVENDSVLHDLTRRTPLKAVGYRYLITSSPDVRGIDVALLYQPGRFRVVSHRSVRIPVAQGERPTRDILHVSGRVPTGDTLDVLVCHLPSRASGERKTRPFRQLVAGILKAQADSLMHVRHHPCILITGDFNDEPHSASLLQSLQAEPPEGTIFPLRLYNLMYGKAAGTYRYHGEWNLLDHVIVSGWLLDAGNRMHTSSKDASVVQLPFLLEADTKYGGYKPFRTYLGPRYKGGYSDHLPVLVDLWMTLPKGISR